MVVRILITLSTGVMCNKYSWSVMDERISSAIDKRAMESKDQKKAAAAQVNSGSTINPKRGFCSD